MRTIFGLPAHPFFVHIPLMLTPFVSIGAIAIAVRPSLRRRFGWTLTGACAVIVVATLLAMSSGPPFDKLTRNSAPIDHHRHLAQTSRTLVIVLFVAVLAVVLAGLYSDRVRATRDGATVAWLRPVATALAIVTIAAAVSSTVWMTQTAYEGIKVTWRNVYAPADN